MHEAERRDTVRRIARAGDPDRALAALFAPRDARDDLFALYAFNVELARIAEQVTKPDLGAIRLQWWREAIERADKIWGVGRVHTIRLRKWDGGADVELHPVLHRASDTRGRNYVAHTLDGNGHTVCHPDCAQLEMEHCK